MPERLPRVEFFPGNALWDTAYISRRLFGSALGKEDIINKWPELGELARKRSLKSDNIKAFLAVKAKILELYRKNFPRIAKSVDIFQSSWNPVNFRFMRALEIVLGTRWPRNVLVKAFVGVNPRCPRDWRNFGYTVPFWVSERRARLISAHEITHFLYFKKLSEIIPDITRSISTALTGKSGC